MLIQEDIQQIYTRVKGILENSKICF